MSWRCGASELQEREEGRGEKLTANSFPLSALLSPLLRSFVMPDILHDFPINVPPSRVFAAVSTPAGLDLWWTQHASGHAALGAEYELGFGPEYNWRATVSRCVTDREFELTMGHSDQDWKGSRVRFELEAVSGGTQVRFAHTGCPRPTPTTAPRATAGRCISGF
jgi:uncharacterized protein YndB with AHSA1/START domain